MAANLRDEIFVEFTRALGTSGLIEGRSLPAPNVAIQRELRNGEYRSAEIRHAQVHLPGCVLKDAESGNLLGEVICVGFVVAAADAKQHKQAGSDFANDSALDCDRSFRDSLYDGTHSCSKVAFQKFMRQPQHECALTRQTISFVRKKEPGRMRDPVNKELRMNFISRRRFLASAAMSVAATRLRAQSSSHATLMIPPEATGPHVPQDYVGLSYEVQ